MKKLILIALIAMPMIATATDSSSSPSRDTIHAAIEACMQENNLTPPQPGQRPSDSDRATMDACLKSKGIDQMPPPPHGPPPQQQTDSQ